MARLGLAAVWLISGAIKLAEPGQTYVAVQAYELVPAGSVGFVATVLPVAEVALGVLLLAGLATRAAAVASAVILLAFIAGVAQAWARGLSIDCGCFGGGGEIAADQTSYAQEIALDIGFLALACWLALRPNTLFAAGRRRGEQPVREDLNAASEQE